MSYSDWQCVIGGSNRSPPTAQFSRQHCQNSIDRTQTRTARHQVVTTLGPKKPHRSSSTTDSTTENYFTAQSNPNLFLETSFTSLQSPSSNSSITNGFHSTRSQPSPVSLRNQPVGTITLGLRSNKSEIFRPRDTNRINTIADYKNGPSILSKSLSLNLVPPKVDLIHDDWYGLAPLASPESLSELSSISSRTSLVPTNVIVDVCQTPKFMRRAPKIIGSLSTCADDVRNVQSFANAKVFPRLFINNNNLQESSSSSNLSFESASSTHVQKCCSSSTANITRSIDESGCNRISDIKEIYTTSESEFQSAEDILDNVLARAGCKEFFNSESNFLETHLDFLQEGSPPPAYFRSSTNTPIYPQLMSPSSPQELDPDIVSNLAIDLSLDAENRSIQFHQSKAESSIDSGSVCRTPSDIHKNVTFNPQVITVNSVPSDIRYSPPIRWRLFKGKTSKSKTSSKKSDLIPSPTRVIPPVATPSAPLKTILSMKSKRTSDDTDRQCDRLVTEECFSRTEQLPLLSDLSVSAGSELKNTSPGYVRRKKFTVYPSDIVVVTKNNDKLGSSSLNYCQGSTSQVHISENETMEGKRPAPTESAV